MYQHVHELKEKIIYSFLFFCTYFDFCSPLQPSSAFFLLKKKLQNTCETDRLRIYLQPNGFTNKHLTNMRRDIFQAIADPTRRAIITLIALQAMTPNAIADNFHTTRQSVSKHLRILTECELVKQEQQGREIYYSLEIEKMKEIDKWIEQFRKIWGTRFNQLDNLLSTMKKQKK
jgi:DNA-binding transcriptional ArsR family regulator